MAYGLNIKSAIGSDDISDFTSFRIFDIETDTVTPTTAAQTFTYTAPSGWTSSNGVFYIVPNSTGVLPSFTASGTTLTASFGAFNASFKANSWKIFWLVETGTDTPSGYGISIKNASNQTVLSSDNPALQVTNSGTLSSYTTTNTSMRLFGVPSGFNYLTDALFVKLEDGKDVIYSSAEYYNTGFNFNVCSSNATSFEYFTVRNSAELTDASGYGMKIYNGNGDLVYHSAYDLFPSNGANYKIESNQAVGDPIGTIDATKDVWVALNFGYPAPLCPIQDGSQPTYWNILGALRSGNQLINIGKALFISGPSSAQAGPHSNSILVVQR